MAPPRFALLRLVALAAAALAAAARSSPAEPLKFTNKGIIAGCRHSWSLARMGITRVCDPHEVLEDTKDIHALQQAALSAASAAPALLWRCSTA